MGDQSAEIGIWLAEIKMGQIRIAAENELPVVDYTLPPQFTFLIGLGAGLLTAMFAVVDAVTLRK